MKQWFREWFGTDEEGWWIPPVILLLVAAFVIAVVMWVGASTLRW
jgi:hypothetical protein